MDERSGLAIRRPGPVARSPGRPVARSPGPPGA